MFVYSVYNFKAKLSANVNLVQRLSLFKVYVFIKLIIEIQSNIKSAVAGNSLTESSKTLSKALISESGHGCLFSLPVQKYSWFSS